MKKQALLIVSFGTSEQKALKSIEKAEKALSEQRPEMQFFRAFTSPIIRKILKCRGENILSPEQVLEELAEKGFTHVIIQPTNVIGGIEYNKLKKTAEKFSFQFEQLKLGRPLLNDMQDVCQLTEILSEEYPKIAGRAIVFMGHGTEHEANKIYRMVQSAFENAGRNDIFVAAAEGKPDIYEICKKLKIGNFENACLVPMMLTAGHHAVKDMAGEQKDSWKNILKSNGIDTECVLKGLGDYKKVREMYVQKLAQIPF